MAKSRTGWVFLKRGKWHYRFTYRDPLTGRERNVQRQAENKTKAREALKKEINKFESGEITRLDADQLTLGRYLDKWLEAAAKPRLAEGTYADYDSLLDRYVRPELGQKMLARLRGLDLQALYAAMQKRGLSARTVRYTHAVLRSALKQAVRWGLLGRNPAELVELPKQTREEMRALSPEESSHFLAAAAASQYGFLFAFALATGMRPEEYLGLQWKDVTRT